MDMREHQGALNQSNVAATGRSLAIMQPYFFPYIGYFQLINAVDQFVAYDDVNYIKRGWIARNRILLNGQEHMVSLQTAGAGCFKRINEIGVGNNAEKLLKTIYRAYRKAPQFDECYPVIERILKNTEKNLARFLFTLIRSVCEYLQINTDLILSSSVEKDNRLRGQEKVLDICERLRADTYVNAIGGQDLYAKADFSKRGVRLLFLESSPLTYKQFADEFVPELSIIDVLMFNDRTRCTDFLAQYTLK